MSEKDFKIGDQAFKLRKLDAMKQFHVVRRIGPMLTDMLEAVQKAGIRSPDKMSDSDKLEQLAKFTGPIMSGLQKLSDQDANYVLLSLLSGVEVHQTEFNKWASVTVGDTMMVQLDLPVMLQAAARSLMFNLSGFFALLPR